MVRCCVLGSFPILADEYVMTQFSRAHDDNTRAIKIGISGEALAILGKSFIHHSWDQDYDAAVLPMLDDTVPCYVFFKLGTFSQFGSDWLLINWVPEQATVSH